MEIKVYKTTELTDKDWDQIVAGFNKSFNRITTGENLANFYKSNELGYSYHAVCYENGKIIGFTSILPFQYLHKEQAFKAGLSCSSFVLKEYRSDVFIFKDMIDSLKEEGVKHGYLVFLGVPNKNSHKYSIVLLGAQNVGYLPYYALPLNLFTVLGKKKNKPFEIFIATCVYIFCYINKFLSHIFNFKEKMSAYRLLITENFHQKRFSASFYSFSKKKNIKFWYRIVNENNIKTAYLMDFRENENRTNKALCNAVWSILRTEQVDIILYVGTLRMKQGVLLKTPSKFVPKPLPLTYIILDIDNKQQFETMSDLNCWDFGLMNFDGR